MRRESRVSVPFRMSFRHHTYPPALDLRDKRELLEHRRSDLSVRRLPPRRGTAIPARLTHAQSILCSVVRSTKTKPAAACGPPAGQVPFCGNPSKNNAKHLLQKRHALWVIGKFSGTSWR